MLCPSSGAVKSLEQGLPLGAKLKHSKLWRPCSIYTLKTHPLFWLSQPPLVSYPIFVHLSLVPLRPASKNIPPQLCAYSTPTLYTFLSLLHAMCKESLIHFTILGRHYTKQAIACSFEIADCPFTQLNLCRTAILNFPHLYRTPGRGRLFGLLLRVCECVCMHVCFIRKFPQSYRSPGEVGYLGWCCVCVYVYACVFHPQFPTIVPFPQRGRLFGLLLRVCICVCMHVCFILTFPQSYRSPREVGYLGCCCVCVYVYACVIYPQFPTIVPFPQRGRLFGLLLRMCVCVCMHVYVCMHVCVCVSVCKLVFIEQRAQSGEI